jgi:putative solute:sodium symporter small subunit
MPNGPNDGGSTTSREDHDARAAGYWKANRRLQLTLLAIWAVVGFGISILLAEPLNEIVVFGFPLGFWFAQQGAIVVFVILIFVYAITMDRIDHEYGVQEQELGAARRRLERRMQRRTTGEAPTGDDPEAGR